MPKRPTAYSGSYAKRKSSGLPSVGPTPQGKLDQQVRYPKKGGKNSRPNSRK